MTDTIPVWLHIVATTVWVGPQFFMFIVTVPAVRTITDRETRLRVLRAVTTRFGWLAWSAMLVLVLTGISNVFDHEDESGISVVNFDWRYSWIFFTKMALVATMIALTALHSFVVGPRQMALAEQADEESEEAARLRRSGIIISSVSLLVALATIFAAALLANEAFSIQKV
jgi:uncharacterized membrane protein